MTRAPGRAFALVAGCALAAACGAPQGGSGGSAAASPTATPAVAASVAPSPGASPGVAATRSPVAIVLKSTHEGSRYVTLTKQQGARRVYTLIADSETGEYQGNGSGTSTFANPHVTFYGKDGERLNAVAPTGTIVEKDKTIVMSGGVQAHTSDGKTLTSDTMRYADASETLYGDGDVQITTPGGDKLQGDTLVWDLRSGRIDVGHAR